jgi:hypothetical protein
LRRSTAFRTFRGLATFGDGFAEHIANGRLTVNYILAVR